MSSVALAAIALLSGASAVSSEPFYTDPKPYSQQLRDNYNLIKYTGWEGPYSDRRGVGLNRDTPLGCKVDQVVWLNRHGERWPDKYDYVQQLQSYGKIESHKGHLNGSLSFVDNWVPYASGPNDGYLSQESLASPYSGLLNAYYHGIDARRRYGHLWDGQSVLPIFASGYERIVDTARMFGEGFLGWNYTDLAAINIIPETLAQGANALAPSCPGLDDVPATFCPVPNSTYTKSIPDGGPWIYTEFVRAAKRLQKENPALTSLEAADIPHLMAIAAFELNVRGSSPWSSVFTSEEWIAFEYLQTSYYYCYFGPGSASGPVIGSLFLNATRTLLVEGPEEAGPLQFSFAHDTDIIHLVAALGFASPDNYDPTQVTFGTGFDVTDLTPQGAHIVFERLVCDEDPADIEFALYSSQYPAAFNASINSSAVYASGYTYEYNGTVYQNKSSSGSVLPFNSTNFHVGITNTSVTLPKGNGWSIVPGTTPAPQIPSSKNHTSGTENIYVRLVLNEAVVPLPGYDKGPGKSAKLSDFDKLVTDRVKGINFAQECGIPESAPQYLDFFWNWNHSTAQNAFPDVLPGQATLLNADGSVLKD